MVNISSLNDKLLFLFDLDGVLYAGKEEPRAIGGKRLITVLRTLGKKLYVLTNTSTHGRDQLRSNLNLLGFEIELDEILTAAHLTSRYLKQKFGSVDCYVIGEEGLKKELQRDGHNVNDVKADFVVVGLDREVSYWKLNQALRFLRSGAKLIATHSATVYMGRSGPELATGAFVKALEYAGGRRAVVIGKPSPLMFRMAMNMAGVGPKYTVMVGDQLETDIYGAKKLGICTVLVLSGVETEKTLGSSRMMPDIVVENVDDLVPLLKGR